MSPTLSRRPQLATTSRVFRRPADPGYYGPNTRDLHPAWWRTHGACPPESFARTGKPPHYRHRSAANELTRRNTPIGETQTFLEASYAQIHNNWLAAIEAGYSQPSKENWRWKRHLELSPGNTSLELLLERAIVNECGDNWSNQMPTASGLVGHATDKRAAVDLVYRQDSKTYSLIELKVDSDNPLFAAIEILLYGLLFVWSKDNRKQLGYDVQIQPVLAADTVTLSVLAPTSYYRDFDLTNLAGALHSGLGQFGQQHALNLGFEFCRLGVVFASDSSPRLTRSAISDRNPIWSEK